MSSNGEGTWCPDSEKTPAWWIWRQLYMCRVNNIQTMSLDYIKIFGMPNSGHQQHDMQTANELITRMLSIADMVKFHNEGIIIRLVNYNDAKPIYEHITNYLNMWKNQLETGYHVRSAPIDDLLAMDKFANSLYAHAKHQFTQDYVDSILARRMSTLFKVNRNTVLKPKKADKVIYSGEAITSEPVEDNKRVSMAEMFLNHKPLPSANGNNGSKWK